MEDNLRELLFSEEAWPLPETLYSCWNAKGLYSPLQFVLRLRLDIRNALESAPSGIVRPGELSIEQVFAFSTYLHETIHWWQHVGSVNGLFLSLIYPAQTHYNRQHLPRILDEIGPVKPLQAYGLAREIEQSQDDIDQEVNIVVNNWHDIEFYRRLVVNPKATEEVANNPYFECIGHSYCIAIGSVISLLGSTFDKDFKAFPNPRRWESEILQLRGAQAQGFYPGSKIFAPPLGAKEIFEGQARFCQLQYLYLYFGKSEKWSDFEAKGMLSGVYVKAFEVYLAATGFQSPEDLDSPVVGLFLLVCDIATNPVEGFAQDFEELKECVATHDPGTRFLHLCWAIREQRDIYSNAIIDYSAAEYRSVSSPLCEAVGFLSPQDLARLVDDWVSQLPSISKLLEEDREFRFGRANLPVRVFFCQVLEVSG